MGTTIKAIETHYAGCRFRSRVEARWAVLFDAMFIKWEYEKEGYEFDGGIKYLPDFWLPELNMWIEVKGSQPTKEEEEKCRLLCGATKKSVALVFSEPRSEEMFGVICDHNFWGWFAISEDEHVYMREEPEYYGGSRGIEYVEEKIANGGYVSECFNGPCLPFFSYFFNAVESKNYSIQGMNAFKSARFGNGGRG